MIVIGSIFNRINGCLDQMAAWGSEVYAAMSDIRNELDRCRDPYRDLDERYLGLIPWWM
jgi:hypothetical protein